MPFGYSGGENQPWRCKEFRFGDEMQSVESAVGHLASMGCDQPVATIVRVRHGRIRGVDDDLFSRSLFV